MPKTDCCKNVAPHVTCHVNITVHRAEGVVRTSRPLKRARNNISRVLRVPKTIRTHLHTHYMQSVSAKCKWQRICPRTVVRATHAFLAGRRVQHSRQLRVRRAFGLAFGAGLCDYKALPEVRAATAGRANKRALRSSPTVQLLFKQVPRKLRIVVQSP
eukprot:6204779-Pleurochrysis_carterae.AAC.1